MAEAAPQQKAQQAVMLEAQAGIAELLFGISSDSFRSLY
jgi:hypothetical protein